jgi:hypothetical protein
MGADRFDSHRAGHVTGFMASHAVGNDKKPMFRIDQIAVFIVAAYTPDICPMSAIEIHALLPSL